MSAASKLRLCGTKCDNQPATVGLPKLYIIHCMAHTRNVFDDRLSLYTKGWEQVSNPHYTG